MMGYAYRVADHAKTVVASPYDGLLPWEAYSDAHEAQAAYDHAWSDFIWTLEDHIGAAWKVVRNGPWRRGHPGGRVIAQSAQHELLLEEDRGGYGYAYVSLTLRASLMDGSKWSQRMQPLALSQLKIISQAYFDRLAQSVPLRIPQGYVSQPYQPRLVAA